MKLKWVLFGLLALLLGFCLWIWSQLEFEDREIDTGFAPVADRFHFLAAVQYLEQLGLEGEERSGFSLIDSLFAGDSPVASDDTIVLVDAFGVLGDERRYLLEDWVDAGGTAFVSTRNFALSDREGMQDELFLDYGIWVGTNDGWPEYRSEMYIRPDFGGLFDDDNPLNREGGIDSVEQVLDALSSLEERPWCPDVFPLIRDASGQYGDITLQFTGNRYLDFDSEFYEGLLDGRGYQLVSVPSGDGRFVFTTDNQLWSNRRIACHDHAWQLWEQTSGNKIWFLVNADSPSLLEILWNTFTLGCVLAGIFIAIIIWRAGQRLGPLIEVSHRTRRAFLEHLEASAVYSWQARQYEALLRPLRQRVFSEAGRRQPGFSSLQEDRQLDVLVELTELERPLLKQHLYDSLPGRMRAGDFEHRVRQLQVILQLL